VRGRFHLERSEIVALLLTTAALIAIMFWLAGTLGIVGRVNEQRQLVRRLDAEVARVNQIAHTNRALIAEVEQLKASQVGALKTAILERCRRANRTNAALTRILRTITKVVRRLTLFRRQSALRTYRRAFLRLQPVDCMKVYGRVPTSNPPPLSPTPPR
jgi:cell division protein FtsB